MNWAQSICVSCWNLQNPDRQVHKLLETVEEVCTYCGRTNTDGIYIRVKPGTIPFYQSENS